MKLISIFRSVITLLVWGNYAIVSDNKRIVFQRLRAIHNSFLFVQDLNGSGLYYSALLWHKEASDIPSKFELLMFS